MFVVGIDPVCLFIVTWTQVGYWRNSIALYDHALKVTSHNDVIHNNRGVAYAKLGNSRQAIADYDRAIEINPGICGGLSITGVMPMANSATAQAISDYTGPSRSIRICGAYNNRGIAYGRLGNHKQAIR